MYHCASTIWFPEGAWWQDGRVGSVAARLGGSDCGPARHATAWTSRTQQHKTRRQITARRVRSLLHGEPGRGDGARLACSFVCTTARPQFGSRGCVVQEQVGSLTSRLGGSDCGRALHATAWISTQSKPRQDAMSRHGVFMVCYTGSPVGEGTCVSIACVPPRVHNLVPGGCAVAVGALCAWPGRRHGEPGHGNPLLASIYGAGCWFLRVSFLLGSIRFVLGFVGCVSGGWSSWLGIRFFTYN